MIYTEEQIKAIDELMKKEEFVEKLSAATSAADFKAAFDAENVFFDDEAAESAYEKFVKVQNEELSEEELDFVAGGKKWNDASVYGRLVAYGCAGCAVGGPVGAAVGFGAALFVSAVKYKKHLNKNLGF